jgi:glucose-1-phosphate thymidylyltransferase
MVKGIVLAGGTGSRLWPITKGVSKQLLPVFDKPLVHYPIATLMLAGIREITIITTPSDHEVFIKTLGDGADYGVSFDFLVQPEPKGLAQAFIIAEKSITGQSCALVLGDNLFHGVGLGRHLTLFSDVVGAQIFAYKVSDPERYGVVTFDGSGRANSLEEKPKEPKSSYAVPGLYFYDDQVLEIAKSVKPSPRGELEITAVNQAYLDKGQLNVSILPNGTAWMDTGTFSSLLDAGNYVRTLQDRQGNKISCLEEIAFKQKWITEEKLEEIINNYKKTEYGIHLRNILKETR